MQTFIILAIGSLGRHLPLFSVIYSPIDSLFIITSVSKLNYSWNLLSVYKWDSCLVMWDDDSRSFTGIKNTHVGWVKNNKCYIIYFVLSFLKRFCLPCFFPFLFHKLMYVSTLIDLVMQSDYLLNNQSFLRNILWLLNFRYVFIGQQTAIAAIIVKNKKISWNSQCITCS